MPFLLLLAPRSSLSTATKLSSVIVSTVKNRFHFIIFFYLVFLFFFKLIIIEFNIFIFISNYF
jgi:hypothetical protein